MSDQETEYLFSYGTLQQEAVQLATFGRQLRGDADTLRGYRMTLLEIRDAHVIATSGSTHHRMLQHIGHADDQVIGTALRITRNELAQADAYEVDDDQRVGVALVSGLRAWVYVQAASIRGDPTSMA